METEFASVSHQSGIRTSLKQIRSAHLVGICGSGMKALAEFLQASGCTVTGSDLYVTDKHKQDFASLGIAVYRSHDAKHILKANELCVYSSAVPVTNPELKRSRELSQLTLSYSQTLGYLMDQYIGVAIAGTHGKSTTTAMVGSILDSAGHSPSLIVGADDLTFQCSGRLGDGPHLIVESCEYNQSFLSLHPRYAAITNIEADHFDCYQNMQELEHAFLQFCRQVEPYGSLVLPAENQFLQTARKSIPAEVTTFAADHDVDADWSIGQVQEDCIERYRCRNRFTINHHRQPWIEILLPLPGPHNRMNALVAAAMAHQTGVSAEAIRCGLAQFRGIKRRFQQMGEHLGMTFIDDYAHHPTAIRQTIQTAKTLYRNRHIWCIYEPHQISRTQALFDDYVTSLSQGDTVCVLPVFAAREKEPSPSSVLSSELSAAIGVKACYCDTLDVAKAKLEDEGRSGDIVITMGAGRIDQLYHEFA